MAWDFDKYNDYKRVRKDIATAKVVMPTVLHKVTVARQVLRDHRPAEGMWPTDWIPRKSEDAKAKYAHLLELEVGNL
jgi:acyl-CoA dehydrogenase